MADGGRQTHSGRPVVSGPSSPWRRRGGRRRQRGGVESKQSERLERSLAENVFKVFVSLLQKSSQCPSLSGGGGVDSSHRSSDCLVITIMELPEESPSSDSLSMLNVLGVYRPPSLDSLPCNLPAQKCRAWTSRSFPRCLLGALCMVSTFEMCLTRNAVRRQPVDQSVCVCGQVYFSSLPLGIYLLMIGQLWLGVVLVSLVPSTLLLLVLYGFCQCLCHELMEALAARRRTLP